MSDITGKVLRDRYHVERLLGRGGMADVYLAFDAQRQTYVAIKLIREDLADDADFIRRFSREAAAWRASIIPTSCDFMRRNRMGCSASS